MMDNTHKVQASIRFGDAPNSRRLHGQASMYLGVPPKTQSLKGQASMEMLVTFGMFITFMVPVLLLVLVASQYGAENSSIYQAQSTSHLLADTINEVYTQGCAVEGDFGASHKILVNLPGNANALWITSKNSESGGEVVVSVSLSNGGNYEAVSPVFARVVPALSSADSTMTKDVRGLKPFLMKCKKDSDGPYVEVTTE
jgi:hypothetical protein